jgi:hypothetical protein
MRIKSIQGFYVKLIAISLSYVTGNRSLTDFIIAPDDVTSWTMLVVQVKEASAHRQSHPVPTPSQQMTSSSYTTSVGRKRKARCSEFNISRAIQVNRTRWTLRSHAFNPSVEFRPLSSKNISGTVLKVSSMNQCSDWPRSSKFLSVTNIKNRFSCPMHCREYETGHLELCAYTASGITMVAAFCRQWFLRWSRSTRRMSWTGGSCDAAFSERVQSRVSVKTCWIGSWESCTLAFICCLALTDSKQAASGAWPGMVILLLHDS